MKGFLVFFLQGSSSSRKQGKVESSIGNLEIFAAKILKGFLFSQSSDSF